MKDPHKQRLRNKGKRATELPDAEAIRKLFPKKVVEKLDAEAAREKRQRTPKNKDK